MPSPLQIALKVTGLDQAKADLQQFAAGGKRSFEELAAEARTLSATSAQTDRALSGVANRVRSMAAALDPASAASLKLRNALTDVERAVAAGVVTTSQAATITGALRREHEALATGSGKVTGALRDAASAHGGLSSQAQAAVHSMRSMTEQFALGVPPTQVLTQQLSHLSYAATGPGGLKAAFGEAVGALSGLITPTTAAVAGFAALVGGAVLLIAHASATETRLRSLDTILTGMGTRSNATASGLDQVVRSLRDTGTSAEEALKAVEAFARVPGINPASAARLVPLARDIGAVTGEDFAGVGAKMAQAFSQGTDAAIKLTYALGGPNALTAAEVKSMQEMAAHGDRAGALRVAIQALQGQFGGSFERSLSDSAKAINNISSAWSNMLDKLSSTTAIQAARNAVIGMLNGIANAANASNPTTPVDSANAARRSLNLAPLTPAQTQELQRQSLGQNNVAGGGLGSAISAFSATANASLARVDPELLRTFEATLIETGMRAVITSSTGGSHVAGSQHYPGNTVTGLGEAVDFNLLDASGRAISHAAARELGSPAYQAYVEFGEAFKRLSPGRGRSGMDFADPGHVDFGLLSGAAPGRSATTTYGSGLFGAPRAAAAPSSPVPSGLSEEQKSALQSQLDYDKRLVDATRQVGESKVYWQAYWQALGSGTKDQADVQRATESAQHAVAEWRAELEKSADTTQLTNQLGLSTAKAYGVDLVAGLRAAAQAQAELKVRQGEAVDVAGETARILQTEAVAAIRTGAEQLATGLRQVAAEERLADATKLGAAAAHEQTLQNEAASRTQDALAKAEATRNPGLIAQAKALQDATLAEVRRTDAAKQAQQIYSAINSRNDQIAVTQLQTGLLGQTPEAIAAATAHLQEQQRLQAAGADLSSEIAKASLANVDALSQANAQYAEAQRRQQQLEDGVRSIADAIDNSLTRSIADAFSGNRVESWGARIKSMLSSIISQITSSMFLRPAFGSLFGALGFGNLAQQFGSFGGGGFGGGGAGGSLTLTPTGNGTFSLSNLSSGASLLNGVSGGGLFGGTSSFFNGIGSSLGFASPVSALSTSEISSLGSLIGIEPNSLGFLGSASSIGSGLFGSTTLGGFLGGAGAGFGAGSLLNSLLGGNQLIGSIGSGVGSLAGAAIGSIFPGVGTLLGGLLGGAGGGLFGLFGNNKPSNFSTGLAVDIGSGAQSDFHSSGNAQNDQTAKQVADSISSFSRSLRQATGGTLSGFIGPDAGSRDGLQLNYDIAGFGAGKYTASSVQDAIDKAKLAMARGLQGVTDTVRTVINAVSDPADLDAAIQFAATYDKLAEAAKDAFASIPSDLNQTGPFAQAKDQIKTIFDGLSANAQKFGLALDPVNAALAEASRRLTDDFNRSISDAITAINDPLQAQIAAIKKAGDAQVREAEAVGGDIVQVNRLTAIQLDQIWKQQTAGLQSLETDLRTGSLSGLTPAASIAAANDNFKSVLAAVRGGNLSRIADLESGGRDLISQAQAAYGNAPQTAGLRGQILSALDQVLAGRSFAEGSLATPPGWIRVGESGPEWLRQNGGATILPAGTQPAGSAAGDLATLLRQVIALLSGGNRITQAGLAELIETARAAQAAPTVIAPRPRTQAA